MSNTYKHKEYGKYRRDIIDWDEVNWGRNNPRSGCKTPRDSKTAKYIIQTLGHKRRRSAERLVKHDLKKFRDYHTYCSNYDLYEFNNYIDHSIEFYDEGKYLEKNFSNPWDYY